MNTLNFWENISRYPRFFISVMFAFFILFIAPFKKLLNTKSGSIIFILGIIIVVFAIIVILQNMMNL